VRVGTSSRADPSSLCRERASIVRLRVMTNLRLRAGDGESLSFRKKEGRKQGEESCGLEIRARR